MKIRIKSSSVRFRLTRADVKHLAQTGYLEDKVTFGEQSLLLAIQRNDTDQLSASFTNNTIILFMPQKMINELQNTERVGFENDSGPLHLLIEKDFTCLNNAAEDQSDNYPNPLAAK